MIRKVINDVAGIIVMVGITLMAFLTLEGLGFPILSKIFL